MTGGRRRIVDVHHMYPSPTELAPRLHDVEAVKYDGGNNFGILNLRGVFRRDSCNRPEDLFTLLSLTGDDRMLMSASDDPHRDFDSPDDALRGFPGDWKQRIIWDNADAFSKLEQRLALQPTGGG